MKSKEIQRNPKELASEIQKKLEIKRSIELQLARPNELLSANKFHFFFTEKNTLFGELRRRILRLQLMISD